jgi:long-chain alkane monooxygenase
VAAKQIHLNAFEMNCVGHLARGMWRHPADSRYRYTDLDYWNEEARLLEAGCFDALFLADVLGTYETAPGDSAIALREAHQVPVNDPLLLVPALAQVTSQLGFAVTISATYEPPFAHARRMSTVDHLTKGRVGWNVVTSYLENAARNFGLGGQIAHDERYERAEEYLEVCYQLWEGAGRTARSCATASAESSPTRRRSTTSTMPAPTSGSRARTCASPRRSAHR